MESALSTRVLTTHNLQNLLEGHYRTIAPQTLLFTNVEVIGAEHRDAQGRRSQYWRCQRIEDKHRQSLADNGCVSRTLRIQINGSQIADTKWHIITFDSDLPPTYEPLVAKHRLRNPLKLGFAASSSSLSSPEHKLFVTMPLPLPSHLPVHFTAPFILAPDRRSIRLDGEEDKYNSWLLADPAPRLYICLLEELLLQHQNEGGQQSNWCEWWPKPDQDADSMLIRSLYSKYIAKTDRRICLTVTGNVISPRDAVFFINDASPEAKLLLCLVHPHLVRLPAEIRNILRGQIKMIDGVILKKAILENIDAVRGAYANGQVTIEDIRGIVRILDDDRSGEDLIGLPLVPLVDGSLATFGLATTTHYYWELSSRTRLIFPEDRLINSKFSVEGLDKKLNLSTLDGSAVQDLLESIISITPRRHDMALASHGWISSFWDEFDQMNLEPDCIGMFPLIQTANAGSYISLQECHTHDVMIMSTSQPEQLTLSPILINLGVTVVPRDSCPTTLRTILDDRCPHFSADSILRFFSTVDSPFGERFSRLTDTEHVYFAQWTRENIRQIPENLLSVARALPIWPTLGGNNRHRFLTASAAHDRMTPLTALRLGKMSEVAYFLQSPSLYTAYSYFLEHVFKVEPLSFQNFRDHLQRGLPKNSILPQADIVRYKSILVLFTEHYDQDNRDIIVPNSNRVLENHCNLYPRSEPLFVDAFQTRQQHLVHPDFQDLEHALQQRFRLRREMDFASFKACVAVIDEDRDGDRRIERATRLYRWYCESLPTELRGSNRWRDLDSFHFIPPIPVQRSAPYDLMSYVRPSVRELQLASPGEVLRPEHEAIAWTQRASFAPSDSLLYADIALGVPSSIEVVIAHLFVLFQND